MDDARTKLLFIDFDAEICNVFDTENFIVKSGTLGNPYPIKNIINYVECGLNDEIEYLAEQDIVCINTSQKKLMSKNPLENLQWKESSKCSFVPNKSDSIFNPQFISGLMYNDTINKLLNNGKVVIAFCGALEAQTSMIFEYSNNNFNHKVTSEESNYSILFGSDWNQTVTKINKGRKIKYVNDDMINSILRGCDKEILFSVALQVWESESLYTICKDEYDNIVGYFQIFGKQENRGILIVLPQFENLSKPLKNILYDFLPDLKSELLPNLVKNNWLKLEEYLLPQIKDMQYQLDKLIREYEIKIKRINDDIEAKQKEYSFLTGILCADGMGEKLVKNVKQVLEYIGYKNVISMDEQIGENNRQEDLQIQSDAEIMVIEVKGHNGNPTEDDCQAILKYISRNLRKNREKQIYGILIVNHNKNFEPKKGTCPAFTKQQIDDAERDQYCLVSTWELYQVIRLFQSGLITFMEIDKEFHTPGLFSAIPSTWQSIGKIEKLYKNTIACVFLNINELKIDDEIIIISGNEYFTQTVTSIEVNNVKKEIASKGDAVSIEIKKNILKSACIYIR